jgi:hypothetical protein
MALSLYRRHRRDCKAGHPEDSLCSEFDERKKGWRRCECPIFVSGTLARRFRRQSTGKWEWDAAKVIAGQWEGRNSWNCDAICHNVTPDVAPKETCVTIVDAIEAFLAKCRNRNIRPPTLAKYKTFANQLAAYCESRGYIYLDQLDVADMDRLYASFKDGIRAKAKKLERLKGFIKFCLKRKWLSENIADDLEAPAGASVTLPKAPFSDEELQRIFAACDAIDQGRRNWTGEDAKDFIYLSIYTGASYLGRRHVRYYETAAWK